MCFDFTLPESLWPLGSPSPLLVCGDFTSQGCSKIKFESVKYPLPHVCYWDFLVITIQYANGAIDCQATQLAPQHSTAVPQPPKACTPGRKDFRAARGAKGMPLNSTERVVACTRPGGVCVGAGGTAFLCCAQPIAAHSSAGFWQSGGGHGSHGVRAVLSENGASAKHVDPLLSQPGSQRPTSTVNGSWPRAWGQTLAGDSG